MAQYKTPGVYVEEITKFPPSIAEVATALPAFIGYTEKAELDGKPLTLVPVYINNLMEYERYFGAAPSPEVTLTLDANHKIVDAAANLPFHLYNSLRLFFSNGGGTCVIVSVGDYNNEVTHAALAQGLDSIKHDAAATLIVMPEAVNMDDHGVSLYTAALAQCAQVSNRMTICDLRCQLERFAFAEEANHFRTNIGNEHLKHGAVYGPWLVTTLSAEARLGHLTLRRQQPENSAENNTEKMDATALLIALTADAQIKTRVTNLSLTERMCKLLADGKSRLLNNVYSLEQAAANLAPDLTSLKTTSVIDYQAPLRAQSLWFLSLLDVLSAVVIDCPDNSLITFCSTINSQAHTRMADSLRLLVAHHHALLGHTGISLIEEAAACTLLGLKDQAAILALSPLPDVSADYVTATTDIARVLIAQQALKGIIRNARVWFTEVELSAETTASTLNHDLYLHFDVFRSWVDRSTLVLNTLPSSGAVAGVYAQVDANRGVWKAPANVALQDVVKPALALTNEDQEDYNVHPTGKSINLIRAFAGKGTLVWGARTLAGNDNEWRYINVRRLFGMVEASVEKGLQAFVFEPNDANTWVKAKSMVESFLRSLWQQGALLGSQPKDAFYVNIGLGKTMTAQDILAECMILEVGLAATRPAEFILYKLTLNMKQS